MLSMLLSMSSFIFIDFSLPGFSNEIILLLFSFFLGANVFPSIILSHLC